ncbi:protein adenylyltransferase SelO [Rhodoferax sp.]|uniref:protein adenylyltransferase SelO n=1 Tax=Rhodoferax sp. TaxID=50421 RepID=UPI00274672CE|nr:YdiU family protein [Rhodoferax sp.]
MLPSSTDRAQLPPDWRWANRFATLGPDFYTELAAQAVPQPYWVGTSRATARLVGLGDEALGSNAWLHALAGHGNLEGARPLASVYSGHQFGVWAGQLGDGRALLLGELSPPAGHHSGSLEIQLKGSGLTPYSRMGDGRAVLRSSIREFLCSEAMHALGIPTTRALSVIGSDLPVYREEAETAAVVARVAPSFIRFGHFEHFAFSKQIDLLRQLADYVIDHHYADCRGASAFAGNPYAALLHAVALRTARMVAQWQSVGFCHGVMNTDNMSILGLTIDYGPFQFLDAFVPGHICNHSDNSGRYAFNRQPQVAYWNLFCLGQALLPLIEDQDLAVAALEPYKQEFSDCFAQQMRAKLGLTGLTLESDPALIDDLLQLLARNRVDYTIFWRRLSYMVSGADPATVRDLFLDRSAFDAWLLRYSELLGLVSKELAANSMLKCNPKFVLRNHLAENAIAAARKKDFSAVQTLLTLLESPFDEHPGMEDFADFPPAWAADIAISCSS